GGRGRALCSDRRLGLSIPVSPAHALGPDLDVLVQLVEVLDDRLHGRARRRVRLGVPHRHGDFLLGGRPAGGRDYGGASGQRREELAPAECPFLPLRAHPLGPRSVPTTHGGPPRRNPVRGRGGAPSYTCVPDRVSAPRGPAPGRGLSFMS